MSNEYLICQYTESG